MKQSLGYYIIKSILKLKGVKKDFSKDPIDFQKIRREDKNDPKGKFFKQKTLRRFKILDTRITEVAQDISTKKLLIFIHGGAFISGPTKLHWDTLKEITESSAFTTWMCNYPKAPEYKISEISKNIDEVYHEALKLYQSNQIVMIGDSVGGTLISALVQRLVERGKELPKKIILVSPVMDASLVNPEINQIDRIDPMLSKTGVLSAKKMCAAKVELQDPMISPLRGSFLGFPKTIIFIAENDITCPDQLLAIAKMKEAKVDVEVVLGKNMPHIWPLLPVMKEAKDALKIVVDEIRN